MTLQKKLDAFKTDFESGGPPMNVPAEAVAAMHRAVDELRSSGILDRVLKIGDRIPEFALPDAEGNVIHSNDLLAKGNLVLSFYRGVW
jgi:hypothetical protein